MIESKHHGDDRRENNLGNQEGLYMYNTDYIIMYCIHVYNTILRTIHTNSGEHRTEYVIWTR